MHIQCEEEIKVIESTLEYLDMHLSGANETLERIDLLIGLEKVTGKPILSYTEDISNFVRDNVSKIIKGIFDGVFNQESTIMLFEHYISGDAMIQYVPNKLSARKQIKLLDHEDFTYGVIFQFLAEYSNSDKVLIHLINHSWFEGAFEQGDTIEILLKRDDLSKKVLKELLKYDKGGGCGIYKKRILEKLNKAK